MMIQDESLYKIADLVEMYLKEQSDIHELTKSIILMRGGHINSDMKDVAKDERIAVQILYKELQRRKSNLEAMSNYWVKAYYKGE